MIKKDDLQNSFGTSRKNKKELSATDIDRIAEGIDTPQKTTAVTDNLSDNNEKTGLIKTSLDFPFDLYEDMKIKLIRRKISMKEYLNELVRQDLYGK
jgi:hypothetical protein